MLDMFLTSLRNNTESMWSLMMMIHQAKRAENERVVELSLDKSIAAFLRIVI
jgi:hypothetical protein